MDKDKIKAGLAGLAVAAASGVAGAQPQKTQDKTPEPVCVVEDGKARMYTAGGTHGDQLVEQARAVKPMLREPTIRERAISAMDMKMANPVPLKKGETGEFDAAAHVQVGTKYVADYQQAIRANVTGWKNNSPVGECQIVSGVTGEPTAVAPIVPSLDLKR